MDSSTREYINKVVDSVRYIYGIESPIDDMENIVRLLGGKIEEVAFDDFCDGSIQKYGEDSFCIKVSPFQNEQRRNFTIAHELGHLFLHMGFRTNLDVWRAQEDCVYTRFGTSEQEYQANEFAAALLMPKHEFIKVINEVAVGNKINMEIVAKRFNVSFSAAVNRGRFLGIIG